jgi:flagellar export protein FliJ
MTKYKFQLETLRRMRIAHRDQQRAALADGFRAEEVLAERRAALGEEQASLRALQRVALTDARLDVNHLLEVQRYEMVLKAEESQLSEQADRLAIEVERRRQSVVEAERAVRALDKLDARRREQHRRESQRLENKLLDEVAALHYPRGVA